MSQKPTVGRIVHFYSDTVAQRSAGTGTPGYGFNGVGAGPYLALVTQVFEDSNGDVVYANLYVIPPFGDPFHEGSVSEGSENVGPTRYWIWPPAAPGTPYVPLADVKFAATPITTNIPSLAGYQVDTSSTDVTLPAAGWALASAPAGATADEPASPVAVEAPADEILDPLAARKPVLASVTG